MTLKQISKNNKKSMTREKNLDDKDGVELNPKQRAR